MDKRWRIEQGPDVDAGDVYWELHSRAGGVAAETLRGLVLVNLPASATGNTEVKGGMATAIVGEHVVYGAGRTDSRRIMARSLKTGEKRAIRQIGPEWFVDQAVGSVNGNWALLLCDEDYTATGRVGRSSVKLGIVGRDLSEPRWVWTRQRDSGNPIIRTIAISEDGKHVAACGAGGQGGWLVVVGVDTGRAFELSPLRPSACGLNDIAFTPDGSAVYAIGSTGRLYRVLSSSGRIDGFWHLGDRSWRRFEKLAVRPDGTLLALGLGSEGGRVEIYAIPEMRKIGEVKSGKGTCLGLAFSGDSRYLVGRFSDDNRLSVWRVDASGTGGDR